MKLLVIAQLHPPHAFFTALCKSRSHLCIATVKSHILHTPTTTTATTDHRCCSIGNRLGSTTFHLGSEHERKMSSIDPTTEQCRPCVSRRSVILLMEDSRVIAVFRRRLIFALAVAPCANGLHEGVYDIMCGESMTPCVCVCGEIYDIMRGGSL